MIAASGHARGQHRRVRTRRPPAPAVRPRVDPWAACRNSSAGARRRGRPPPRQDGPAARRRIHSRRCGCARGHGRPVDPAGDGRADGRRRPQTTHDAPSAQRRWHRHPNRPTDLHRGGARRDRPARFRSRNDAPKASVAAGRPGVVGRPIAAGPRGRPRALGPRAVHGRHPLRRDHPRGVGRVHRGDPCGDVAGRNLPRPDRFHRRPGGRAAPDVRRRPPRERPPPAPVHHRARSAKGDGRVAVPRLGVARLGVARLPPEAAGPPVVEPAVRRGSARPTRPPANPSRQSQAGAAATVAPAACRVEPRARGLAWGRAAGHLRARHRANRRASPRGPASGCQP